MTDTIYGLNGLYIVGILLMIAVSAWHGGRLYQAHRYHTRHQARHAMHERMKLVSMDVQNHEASPYSRIVGNK